MAENQSVGAKSPPPLNPMVWIAPLLVIGVLVFSLDWIASKPIVLQLLVVSSSMAVATLLVPLISGRFDRDFYRLTMRSAIGVGATFLAAAIAIYFSWNLGANSRKFFLSAGVLGGTFIWLLIAVLNTFDGNTNERPS